MASYGSLAVLFYAPIPVKQTSIVKHTLKRVNYNSHGHGHRAQSSASCIPRPPRIPRRSGPKTGRFGLWILWLVNTSVLVQSVRQVLIRSSKTHLFPAVSWGCEDKAWLSGLRLRRLWFSFFGWHLVLSLAQSDARHVAVWIYLDLLKQFLMNTKLIFCNFFSLSFKAIKSTLIICKLFHALETWWFCGRPGGDKGVRQIQIWFCIC